MEEMLEKRSEGDIDWDRKMGREEIADLGSLMDADIEVELDPGFCLEMDSEVTLAGQVSPGSQECSDSEEVDWCISKGHTDSLVVVEDMKEGRAAEIEAYYTSKEIGETDENANIDMEDQRSKEEMVEEVLDAFLGPREEIGVHVRLTIEEVESYYRFSCRCNWLCGKLYLFILHPLSFLLLYYINSSLSNGSHIFKGVSCNH